MIKTMFLNSAEPRHGKILAEQRLAYRQLSAQKFHPDLLQLVILLHLSAGIIFGGSFILHLLAFQPKDNRPRFKSMYSGRIHANSAHERHLEWK